MAHHLTSADDKEEDEEEEDNEEHFKTAPLNDDVWMEEPVPDRHLSSNSRFGLIIDI